MVVDVAKEGRALADAVSVVLSAWVQRSVRSRIGLVAFDAEVVAAAKEAGDAAVDEVVPVLRSVLAADVDRPVGSPLAVLRQAVLYPTVVLRRAGVAPIRRSPEDESRFPDDVYGLVPATWSDIDESLVEPGLRWSAAKAWEFRRRHERRVADEGSPPR